MISKPALCFRHRQPASTTVETPPELVRATGTEPGCLLLGSVVKRYQLLGTRRPV